MNEPALRRRNVAAPNQPAPTTDERTPLLAKTIPSGWSANSGTALAPIYTNTTLQWLKDFISNLLQQACRFLWFWSSDTPSTPQETGISPAARYFFVCFSMM
jgi:hypothetical protein